MATNYVTQTVVETLSANESAPVVVSQSVVETLSGASRDLLVSQLVVETLSRNREQPPPQNPPSHWTRNVLIEVSSCRRALSGPDGDYETGSFTVTLSDMPRDLRDLLSKTPTKYFLKKVVTVDMASLALIKAGSKESRRVAYGVVAEAPELGTDGLSVTLRCVDFVGSEAWAGR